MNKLISIPILALVSILLVGCGTDGQHISLDNLNGAGTTITQAQGHLKDASKEAKDLYSTGAKPDDSRILKLETDLTDAQNNLKFSLDDVDKAKAQVTSANKTIDSQNKKIATLNKSLKHYKIITILALYLGSLVFYVAYINATLAKTAYPVLKLVPSFLFGLIAVSIIAVIYFLVVSVFGLLAWIF